MTTPTSPEAEYDKQAKFDPSLVFEEACLIAAPFFDPAQGWNGKPLTMYAQQALREKFPQLAPQDVAILLAMVERHYTSGNQPQ